MGQGVEGPTGFDDDDDDGFRAEDGFAQVRSDAGLVSISRARGSLSAGAREVPITDVAVVEVKGGNHGDDPYVVSVPLGTSEEARLALLIGRSFGAARSCAAAFARVARVPIRDLTFGAPLERTWEDWNAPLLERLPEEGLRPPQGDSPGRDLVRSFHGDTTVFRARAGWAFRMLARTLRDGRRQKTSLVGWLLLPIGLVFMVVLVPIALLAFVALTLAAWRGRIALEASPAGVVLRGFVTKEIAAADLRDVEVLYEEGRDGRPRPHELVLRSDGTRIAFAGDGEEELRFLRDSVLAALRPRV